MPPILDLSPDDLLSTTRAVRKRLDLERPVEMELVRECIEMAAQAPTGSNAQGWHFVVITGAGQRENHVHDVQITKEPPHYRMG